MILHVSPVSVFRALLLTSSSRILGMTQGIRENFAHYKNVTDEKTIKEVRRIAIGTD